MFTATRACAARRSAAAPACLRARPDRIPCVPASGGARRASCEASRARALPGPARRCKHRRGRPLGAPARLARRPGPARGERGPRRRRRCARALLLIAAALAGLGLASADETRNAPRERPPGSPAGPGAGGQVEGLVRHAPERNPTARAWSSSTHVRVTDAHRPAPCSSAGAWKGLRPGRRRTWTRSGAGTASIPGVACDGPFRSEIQGRETPTSPSARAASI